MVNTVRYGRPVTLEAAIDTMAAGMPPLGSAGASNPGTTGANDSGMPINTQKKTTTPAECPCRIETTRGTKYLIDQPVAGATPVIVEQEEYVCDTPQGARTRVLCEETNAANGMNARMRRRRGLNDLANAQDGAGTAADSVLPINANVSYGEQQKQEPPPTGFAAVPTGVWIGGGILITALGIWAVTK